VKVRWKGEGVVTYLDIGPFSTRTKESHHEHRRGWGKSPTSACHRRTEGGGIPRKMESNRLNMITEERKKGITRKTNKTGEITEMGECGASHRTKKEKGGR